MTTEHLKLLNTEIRNLTRKELLGTLHAGSVFTPNADHLITLQSDLEFYKAYQKAEFVVVDSQILFFLMKYLLKTPIKEKIAGSDLLPAFCEYHKKNEDMSIFLLGGSENSGPRVKERINGEVGRPLIVGTYSPPFGFEHDPEECSRIVALINASGARTLAVGVGAPKQEKWIMKHRELMPKVQIQLGIGMTIDLMAGTVRRAPKWMQDAGLEWFYRMAKEPYRLIKRYLWRDLPIFWHLFLQRLGKYQNPFVNQ